MTSDRFYTLDGRVRVWNEWVDHIALRNAHDATPEELLELRLEGLIRPQEQAWE